MSCSLAVTFINSPQSVEAQIGQSVNFTCDTNAIDPFLRRRFIQYQLNGTIAVTINANEPGTIKKYERLENCYILIPRAYSS